MFVQNYFLNSSIVGSIRCERSIDFLSNKFHRNWPNLRRLWACATEFANTKRNRYPCRPLLSLCLLQVHLLMFDVYVCWVLSLPWFRFCFCVKITKLNSWCDLFDWTMFTQKWINKCTNTCDYRSISGCVRLANSKVSALMAGCMRCIMCYLIAIKW